jgi:NADPH:quinone reductase
MRALIIDDGALQVEQRPDPQPGPTDVVVAVRAAGLNGADMLQRRGLYAAPRGAPADIPGLEFAGEIVALGDGVTRWPLGKRVMGIVAGGAQAEYLVVDETHVLPVPLDLDLVHAGGFPEVFTTAHDALITQAGLGAGERLLVTGAAGGVGTAAIQIGALVGAHVTASLRNEEYRGYVESLGAAQVITPDQTVAAGPFDVILELVGAASLDHGVFDALANEARIVVIGVGSGAQVEVNLLKLMATRSTLRASTLRARSREEKAYVTDAVRRDLLGALEAGVLRIPLEATYPLEEATAAYDRFVAGNKAGKIVLTI